MHEKINVFTFGDSLISTGSLLSVLKLVYSVITALMHKNALFRFKSIKFLLQDDIFSWDILVFFNKTMQNQIPQRRCCRRRGYGSACCHDPTPTENLLRVFKLKIKRYPCIVAQFNTCWHE